MAMSRILITYKEGGQLQVAWLRIPPLPKYILPEFKGSDIIIYFKCGRIYDGFLANLGYSPWRHILNGGRREGKRLYKQIAKELELQQQELQLEAEGDVYENL